MTVSTNTPLNIPGNPRSTYAAIETRNRDFLIGELLAVDNILGFVGVRQLDEARTMILINPSHICTVVTLTKDEASKLARQDYFGFYFLDRVIEMLADEEGDS